MSILEGVHFNLEVSTKNCRDWFVGLAREAWLNTYQTSDTERDVEFLFNELGLETASSVLDVGCAHGRHVREIIERRQIPVCAVDSSSGLIHHARSLTFDTTSIADYFEVSVESIISCEPRIDCGYSLGTSFGYHEDFGLEHWLGSISAMLVPGGRFLFETVLVTECFSESPIRRSHKASYGDISMVREEKIDWDNFLLRTEYTYLKNDFSETVCRYFKIYSIADLIFACENSGFRVCKIFNRERRLVSPEERSSRYGFLLERERA